MDRFQFLKKIEILEWPDFFFENREIAKLTFFFNVPSASFYCECMLAAQALFCCTLFNSGTL